MLPGYSITGEPGRCKRLFGFGDCREFNYCGATATQYGNGRCVRGRCVCDAGFIDSNCSQYVRCLYWRPPFVQPQEVEVPVIGGKVGETRLEVRFVNIPGEWRHEGVDSFASTSDRGVVSCSAEHLTDFAGIVLYPPPPPRITFPEYSGEDYAWEVPERTINIPSRVGEAGFYILLLDLFTTGFLGMMLHHW